MYPIATRDLTLKILIVQSLRRGTTASAAGLRRETIAGSYPFLLHVAVQELEGVKAKVPFPQFLHQIIV
jgi:hypothetical protein